jgi:hypothetical protein
MRSNRSFDKPEKIEVVKRRAFKRCQLCEQARSTKCVGPCALRDVHAQMSKSVSANADLKEDEQ